MNLRNYNIYFHTHTISGIIICGLLYVIFFAGSFSFFKDEISSWQRGVSFEQHKETSFPYETFLDSMDREYGLAGRDLTLYFYANTLKAGVSIGPSKDTLNEKASEGGFFSYDFITKEKTTYTESYDMAEFLYRLHFLAQLNGVVPFRLGYPFGYIIAGLVSFLFLFALITGLLVHWDKLVSNFFLFRPWSKLKTIWTDLHTVLGVIGFPYQFVFAFTGIILITNIAFIAPFTHLLYGDNPDKVYEDLGYTAATEAEYLNKPLEQVPDIRQFIGKTEEMWPDAFIKLVTVKNYGDQGMQLAIQADADHRKSFAGTGVMVYDLHTGEVLQQKSPYGQATYVNGLRSLIYRLHFGDYGGYFLKVIYFIMGIMGCLVIVSGILIWLVARDKNSVPPHKRKFNFWLSNVYLATCLTMFPVTAFTFIAVKMNAPADQDFIYHVYFYSWLILALYYIVRRDINRTNRETLLLGAVLSLCVPVTNGIYSGNWPWKTFADGAMDIFFLDLLWIAIAVVAYISYLKVRTRKLEDIKLKPKKQHKHKEKKHRKQRMPEKLGEPAGG
ncbi:putative iron-regulated membrane protein [Anseongella ginsenosidimutans]|uniref:Putative iron-regulated membrane protein n=1 Tax=Anseongella ginsenosidimutans TaxID=496056 RepID=A0A4R3KV70_9SPHI|nr:PepSY-associated TM helix domain-containing protein [Anseongella ginsenosidimutans]QEC51840.1 PepSY domain-containing protein [Anseongella ginsenosidimutans]TCS89215.1 putative iron-regulated membrane protein [Anseongella ginsenosidimutans]